MKEIKLLILDVDGVLTDGKICLTSEGEELKNFHVHDGLGIKRLQEAGITVAVISSRKSKAVEIRMKELTIKHYYSGQEKKIEAFQQLLQLLKIPAENVAYMGDDLPDIPVMQQVGFPIAVANAVPDVLAVAHWTTQKKGGEGAVREMCDYLLGLRLKKKNKESTL